MQIKIKEKILAKEVEIIAMNKLGDDARGATYDFSIPSNDNFIFITLKSGSLSGNTYHEGKSAATNPKTFILLSGIIKFRYRNITKAEHKEVEISKPSIIQNHTRIKKWR